jgi:hypothetical protein
MDKEKIEKAVSMIIEAIGEDPKREGLLETPKRVCKMYEEIFSGLGKDAKDHLSKTFELVDTSMVVEKDINFFSICEHHFLPFYGKVNIAYIPNGRVVGLSKLARCVEVYSKKPQLQERLTMEIADAIMKFLQAKACLVVISAEHMCMTIRGVKKPKTLTVTSTCKGLFNTDLKLKDEAYRLMGM